jgi:hypothetical protein
VQDDEVATEDEWLGGELEALLEDESGGCDLLRHVESLRCDP